MAFFLSGCAHDARPTILDPTERTRLAAEVDAYRRYALEPARLAPPTVRWDAREVAHEHLTARVTPIRPEDAAWNRWPDGTSRLFNNRMAHVFLVHVTGEGPLAWTPSATTLDLNHEDNRLAAAPNAEALLGELTYWAVMQERGLLPGDLAARTRASGPFRASYLPLRVEGDVLEGLVAFPILPPEDGDPDLSALHVVALRLTLAVETPRGAQHLVWLFD